MPVAFAFQELRTFMVCASGKVTFEEWRDFHGRVLADPHLRRGAQMLVDACAVSGAPSADELRLIATDMLPMVERGLGPVAIVTGSPMLYGVARMFGVFAELVNATVMPFRCFDEAKDWLANQTREQSYQI
jgi:hypothetical protein